MQLSNSIHKIESELDSLLKDIILDNPSDGEVMSELLDVHYQLKTHRDDNQSMILSQWNELKEMLNESMKSIHKFNSKHPPNDSSSQDKDNILNVWMPAISTFADILLQVRLGHQRNWESLKSSEIDHIDDILRDRQSVILMYALL